MFLQLSRIGLFGTNVPLSSFKIVIYRQYSFQKLTEFSQGYNALDANVSNVHEILSRDICVSSTSVNKPIWSKESLSLPS
jgi:hypothetical protein